MATDKSEASFPLRAPDWYKANVYYIKNEMPVFVDDDPNRQKAIERAYIAGFEQAASEHEALLQRERERSRGLLEAAENLLKTAEENEPEFVAHKRYTYADCQQIFKPIADAIERLDNSLEAYRASAKEKR